MDKFDTFSRNVISMTDGNGDTGASAVAQVLAYWEALRGAREMPKRSEIDPRGIEQSLEYCFIVERVAAGIARFRVAGSHLNDLMGMEVRGMPLTSFFVPAFRREVSDTLEEVFQRPAHCDLTLKPEKAAHQLHLNARMVLLPLKSDLGDVSRCLGCVVAPVVVGRTPHRFEVAKKSLRAIVSGSTETPDTHEQQVTATASVGFAEAKSAFEEKTDTKRPSFLRVIK